MSPVLAQSGRGQSVEFTSAFKVVAEVHGWMASTAFDAGDPGCVKTSRSITAPGISGLVVTLRAKKAEIRPSLGITTKSDFVFAQPRPLAAIWRIRIFAAQAT
jgi:hypothetical protein